jgi:hypothetical protein
MHFQHYKQFSIHKLGSKKDIANFDKAKVPSKKKQVTEEFIHPGTEPEVPSTISVLCYS